MVSIAVEGPSDVGAVRKILTSRSLEVDESRIFVTRGKSNLDKKIASYNRAAQHSPWLLLRDADHDQGDCAVKLREALLPAAHQNRGLCFRLATRSLEAWLLADGEAFAGFFSVALSAIPDNVEQLRTPSGL